MDMLERKQEPEPDMLERKQELEPDMLEHKKELEPDMVLMLSLIHISEPTRPY